MGFKEKDLLEMLDSENVKSKILQLVRDNIEKLLPISMSSKADDAEESSLKKQLEQTQEELEQTKKTLEQYESACTQLKNKIQELEKAIQQSETQNDELSKNLRESEEQIKTLQSKETALSEQLNDSRAAMQKMRAIVEEPAKYLTLYRKLSQHSQDSLYNVVRDTNEIMFIASCTREDNLRAIWNYMKDIAENEAYQEDTMILQQIFDYFFEVYNASLPEPKYIRDDVEIGDYLDDEYYDRGSGSATSGVIAEIILRGYKSKNTGRIICRSVVRA